MPEKTFRILYFTRYPVQCAGTRYRIMQFIPRFAREGFRVDVHWLVPEGCYRLFVSSGHGLKKLLVLPWLLLRLAARMLTVSKYDLVVIHKDIFPYGPGVFEALVLFLNKRIVYEFDDAMFLPYSETAEYYHRFRNHKKITKLIAKSRHVIAGNEYLATFARNLNPEVSVVPTVVNLSRYDRIKEHRNSKKVIVGWTGTSGNLPHLKMLSEPIKKLQARLPYMELEIVSDNFIGLDSIKKIERLWKLGEEIDSLLDFDIGVMPLTDDPWSRGKCGFKLIQYMAAGLPVVASPVGANNDIVQHGVNGFLAKTPEEWEHCLGRLIVDPDLRASMGQAARKTVEEKYCADIAFQELKRIFRNIIANES